MGAKRDYYEVLGVARTASADEIRAAYRKLARQFHPDVNKAADAPERFAEVQEAYDVLSDAEKRKSYDQWGHAGPSPFPGGGGGGGGRRGTYTWTNVAGQRGPGSDFNDFDVGSIFEEIFGGPGSAAGRAGPFGAQARARSKPSRGREVSQDIEVDFMTAALGGKKSIRVRRGGSTQTIEVTIPKGVREGTKLRVQGAGSPSSSGGPPGDLILTVRVAEHPHFKREGIDVEIEVPVSLAEAALGATVSVPTLRGRAEVTIPPGSPSGRRLRLRGQGVEEPTGAAGDLYVVVKIVPPARLDDETRSAMESLRDKLPGVRTGPPWTD